MYIIKTIISIFLLVMAVEASAVDELKSNILNSIENFAESHKIQAVYAVSEKGKIIVSGAQGFYNLEENQRLNLSQIMPILSVTKQITATAILYLQDKGLLSTNDSVAKLLPVSTGLWQDNHLPKWADKVTVHHLLTHSSGIAEYIWNVKVDNKQTGRDVVKSVINFAAERPIEFEPGSNYKYCNTGYVLLGAIIEQVTKRNLDEFLKKEFFKPLGMKNTFLLSLEEAIKIQKGLLVHKYPVRYYAIPSSKSPKFMPINNRELHAPHADGGIVSNVEDLVKWNDALHHGKILSNKSYQQMVHPYFKIVDKQTGYASYAGYGIYIAKIHSGKLFYHYPSSGFGARCDAGYIPKDDISLAIMSNVTLYVPDEMVGKVDFRKPENQIDISYFRDALVESL